MNKSSAKSLVYSPSFQGILRKILQRVIENPWAASEPDKSTDEALQKLIREHDEAILGSLGVTDLTHFVKDYLAEEFPEMKPLAAPLPTGERSIVDVGATVEKMSVKLMNSYGLAVFRFPLARRELGVEEASHDFGSLGSIKRHAGKDSQAEADRAPPIFRNSYSAQVCLKGFLFDGASELASKASEQLCSLLVLCWLTGLVQLSKGSQLAPFRKWSPRAFVFEHGEESSFELFGVRESLADAERLCGWSRVNDSTIILTFGLARPKQHSISSLADTIRFSGLFDGLDAADADRFRVAFHFFASSMVSSTNAHAILNLCIALECLLGWDLGKSEGSESKWSPAENRSRIEARLELATEGGLAKRQNSRDFIEEIFKYRNKIAHGKRLSLSATKATDVYSRGCEFFKKASLFYIEHLSAKKR